MPKKKCTTPISFPGAAETPQDMQPTKPGLERSNAVYAKCFHITGQVYSDLPGPFLCASTSGMKYQMVVYDYDSNNILVKSMMSRSAANHTRAYKVIYEYLVSRGCQPKLQKLDNEASASLKHYLTKKVVKFQLTPAGIYRCNSAKCAIRTWKTISSPTCAVRTPIFRWNFGIRSFPNVY